MSVDISVIVPVYNKRDSVAACVESVASQGMDPGSFEVVLVNDGSTDDSLEECQRLAERYGFVRVIDQPNAGVSAARNAGIAAATGTYVLFLDADDALGAGSLPSIAETFKRYHDQADLLAYPIRYIDVQTGEDHGHKRETWLNGTGLYSLQELPYLCFTTMNTCVKREAALAHPFSTELALGEDQLFNTTVLAGKAQVAYCAQAEYRYFRGLVGNSSAGQKPVRVFDQMIALYQGLLAIAQKYPDMAAYCHEMILYNFDWRIRSASLFPQFGSADERARNEERLGKIVRSIPVQRFLDNKYLTSYNKLCILMRYDALPSGLQIKYGPKKATLSAPDGLKWRVIKPTVRLLRCIRRSEGLYFFAVLENPLFAIDLRDPQLAVRFGGQEHVLELAESSYTMRSAHVPCTRAWTFGFTVPVNAFPTDVEFSLSMGGEHVRSMRVLMQPKRANARPAAADEVEPAGAETAAAGGAAPDALVFSDCTLQVAAEGYRIGARPHVGELRERMHDKRRDASTAALRHKVRAFAKRNAGREIWLYSDLPTSTMKNSALVQFLADAPREDGILRYYVTEDVAELERRRPNLAGKLVKWQSEEHMVLFLNANLILAAYLDSPTYMPDEDLYAKVADLSRPKSMVYLQHGVLHAHMPWYCSYDRKTFDYEVVSTTFEVRNLVENYAFARDALITSGSPRMDDMSTGQDKPRKIIYAPSWRASLVAGGACERLPLEGSFQESVFLENARRFVQQVIDSRILETYGYSLEIKLHPNFEFYRAFFEFDDERVSLAPSSVDEGTYAIMITDFSSYLYDFLYAGARIQYYLPDEREFFGGENTYCELDLPFEEGFGPYSNNPADAVRDLEALIVECEASRGGANGAEGAAGALYAQRREGEGVGEESPGVLYAQRREGFFLHEDGRNTQRLYDALRALPKL